MKSGNKYFKFIIIFLAVIFMSLSYAEENITSSGLINLDDIKPSFDELDERNEKQNINQKLKAKRKKNNSINSPHAVLIGLDKITAKSSKIKLKINEIKNFGPLEIRILKCGKAKVNNRLDDVAYMQVKDLSKNENEKVFIFNGWTFASDPNITPFDHAIYDLQLKNCYNV